MRPYEGGSPSGPRSSQVVGYWPPGRGQEEIHSLRPGGWKGVILGHSSSGSGAGPGPYKDRTGTSKADQKGAHESGDPLPFLLRPQSPHVLSHQAAFPSCKRAGAQPGVSSQGCPSPLPGTQGPAVSPTVCKEGRKEGGQPQWAETHVLSGLARLCPAFPELCAGCQSSLCLIGLVFGDRERWGGWRKIWKDPKNKWGEDTA